MLTLFISLFSLTAFAGEIVDLKNNARIFTECAKFEHEKCVEERIVLSDLNEPQDRVLGTFVKREITDPHALFLLREKIEKLQIMPISSYLWDAMVVTGGVAVSGFVVGAFGFPFMLIGEMAVANVFFAGGGVLMMAGAAGLVGSIAGIPALDLATLPVRALVKKIRINNFNKKEMIAYEMLQVLLNPDIEKVSVSHKKFKALVKTFQTIKN